MPRGGQGAFIQYGKISIQGAPNDDLDACKQALADIIDRHSYPEQEKEYTAPYDEDDEEEDDESTSDSRTADAQRRVEKKQVLSHDERSAIEHEQKLLYDEDEEDDDGDDVDEEEEVNELVRTAPEWMKRASK